ncbi:MAG: 50S ribosomal protein L22 [Nanoarchaeota archaeon]
MSDYRFSYKPQEPHAKALGRSLSISPKQSQEICRVLRGMPVTKAKELLSKTMNLKEAIPFKHHYTNVGHRKGKIGPGRYPILACKEIRTILTSAETNAAHKGLGSNLIIKHIIAQEGPKVLRRMGHHAKRTHIEVVLVAGKDEPKKIKPIKQLTKPSVTQ